MCVVAVAVANVGIYAATAAAVPVIDIGGGGGGGGGDGGVCCCSWFVVAVAATADLAAAAAVAGTAADVSSRHNRWHIVRQNIMHALCTRRTHQRTRMADRI